MWRLIYGIPSYYLRQLTCKHEWHLVSDPYNAEQDAACYRDGFNYSPRTYLVCSKCERRKRTGEDAVPLWWWVFGLPLIVVGGAVLTALMPLIILVDTVREEFLRPKRAA